MSQVRRRQVLLAAGSLLTVPLARAQSQARLPVIGMLSPAATPTPEQWARTAYAMRLEELGWIEGKNVTVEQAHSGEREDLLPALAEELVRKRVDVILAISPEAAVAAARATKTLPIVFSLVTSPIELGLIKSFAKPASNVTGVAWNAGGEVQVAKPLEFLKEIAPHVARLASIFSPSAAYTVAGAQHDYSAWVAAIKKYGFDLRIHEVRRNEDLEATFAEILDSRAQGDRGCGNAVHRSQPSTNRRICQPQSPSKRFRREVFREGRWTCLLRSRWSRNTTQCNRLCRSDSARYTAKRSTSRNAEQIRIGSKSENSACAEAYRASVAAPAR